MTQVAAFTLQMMAMVTLIEIQPSIVWKKVSTAVADRAKIIKWHNAMIPTFSVI